jgi:hypothetical protein
LRSAKFTDPAASINSLNTKLSRGQFLRGLASGDDLFTEILIDRFSGVGISQIVKPYPSSKDI